MATESVPLVRVAAPHTAARTGRRFSTRARGRDARRCTRADRSPPLPRAPWQTHDEKLKFEKYTGRGDVAVEPHLGIVARHLTP